MSFAQDTNSRKLPNRETR